MMQLGAARLSPLHRVGVGDITTDKRSTPVALPRDVNGPVRGSDGVLTNGTRKLVVRKRPGDKIRRGHILEAGVQ